MKLRAAEIISIAFKVTSRRPPSHLHLTSPQPPLGIKSALRQHENVFERALQSPSPSDPTDSVLTPPSCPKSPKLAQNVRLLDFKWEKTQKISGLQDTQRILDANCHAGDTNLRASENSSGTYPHLSRASYCSKTGPMRP